MSISDLVAAELTTQREYALVFSESLAESLAEKWRQHGSTNCIPSPVMRVDGTYMLCADLLSEVVPGGLLYAMWTNSDQEAIAEGVEVVLLSEAVALLPPDPESP